MLLIALDTLYINKSKNVCLDHTNTLNLIKHLKNCCFHKY